jgi:hypothetical protein
VLQSSDGAAENAFAALVVSHAAPQMLPDVKTDDMTRL